MTEHPGFKLIDIFAVILKGFSYKPTMHIHYESKTVSVKDGLPKFKDMPEDLGGSGTILPEWIYSFTEAMSYYGPLNHSVMIIQMCYNMIYFFLYQGLPE